MKAIDLTGQRFGMLVVLERAGSDSTYGRKNAVWRLRCDCGRERTALGIFLRAGRFRSCGCWRHSGEAHVRHGYARSHQKTAEYRAWCQMRARCHNPHRADFPNYGGRGIAVSERWDRFEAFLADMGLRPSPAHSLDRKNNEGSYSPDNCRWATPVEQANNRRPRRKRSLPKESAPHVAAVA